MATDTITELQQVKVNVEAELETAKRDLEAAQSRYDEMQEQHQGLNSTIALLAKLARGREAAASTTEPVVNTDFTGARNMIQRLERIGDQTGGVIRLTQAAEILIEAGVTKAKKRTLVSSVYKALDRSDTWEKVKPGLFHRVDRDDHAEGEASNPMF